MKQVKIITKTRNLEGSKKGEKQILKINVWLIPDKIESFSEETIGGVQ